MNKLVSKILQGSVVT